jgi:hypothetical protein
MVVVSLWRLEWETETPAIIFLLRPGWMDGWKEGRMDSIRTVSLFSSCACSFYFLTNQGPTDRMAYGQQAAASADR